MPANLENSAVATGLEKVSFHSNPKERQCQENALVIANTLFQQHKRRLYTFMDTSKTSLNIWKFMVHILLKPGLENFEHYFTSM